MPYVMSAAKSIGVLVVAYIGGRGSLWGWEFAANPFVYAMEFAWSFFSKLSGLNLVLQGLLLILIMIYYPGGAAKVYQNLIYRFKGVFLRPLVNRDAV